MPDQLSSSAGGFSRREALRRLGFVGAAVAAGPAFLAACGSSSKKTATNTTAAGGTGSTAAPAATTAPGATTAGTAAAGGDPGQQLLAALGLSKSDKLGTGLSWTMGSVLALTGNGSFYGKTMGRGIDLAVKHIKAAGGPDIKVIYKDHKSGDPQAGVQAMTELGTSKVPAKLASYGDDILSMLPLTQQYKCLTLDGGGANGGAGQSQDFFWGCRALPGLDPIPGLMKYLTDANPGPQTIGVVGWDLGAQNNDIGKKLFLDGIKPFPSLTFNNLFELAPPNTTDFNAVLTKVKANQPDILLYVIWGQDPGFFIDQAQSYNLKSKMYTYELTPDGINASKGAFDSIGITFSTDYFDAANPSSKLSKLFVSEFKAAYKDPPDFYAANYYEDTLALWDFIRRVLVKGGDINSGVDLQNAMKDKLTVASVYGGDDSAVGTMSWDPGTHSLSRRPMGVFTYKGGKVTQLASFNIGGADYKKLA